jgi:hypothetical protein
VLYISAFIKRIAGGILNKVTFKEEQVTVYGKYGEDSSIGFVFQRFGINQIFSLAEVYIVPKSLVEIQESDLTAENQIISPITDWISPYWIVAKNDIDIPNNGNKLTGGNHGTNNGEGDPTAEFVRLDVFIGNTPIKNGLSNMVVDKPITLVTTNLVEASNTHISYPRKIVEEKVTYVVKGSEIKVKVEFQVKEPAYIIEYSGLQTNGQYYDQFSIPNSEIEGWQPIGTQTYRSGAHEQYGLSSQIILNKEGSSDWLVVSLDGYKKMSLADGVEMIQVMEAPVNKTYFRLLYDTSLMVEAGDVFWFKGSYSFTNSSPYNV